MFRLISLLHKSRVHKVRKSLQDFSTPNIRHRWNNLSALTPREKNELLHGEWRNALPVQITRDSADRDFHYYVNERIEEKERQHWAEKFHKQLEWYQEGKEEGEKESSSSETSSSVETLSFPTEEAAVQYIMQLEEADELCSLTNSKELSNETESNEMNNQFPTLQLARQFFDNLALSANAEIDVDEHVLSESAKPFMSDLERREEECDVNRHFFADYYIQQGVIGLAATQCPNITNSSTNDLSSSSTPGINYLKGSNGTVAGTVHNECNESMIYQFIDAMLRPAHGLFWVNVQYPLVRLTIQHQLEQHCKAWYKEHFQNYRNNSRINSISAQTFLTENVNAIAKHLVFTQSQFHPSLFVIEKMPEQALGEAQRKVYTAESSIIAQRERAEANLELESDDDNNPLLEHYIPPFSSTEQLQLPPVEEEEEHVACVKEQEQEHETTNVKIDNTCVDEVITAEASMLSLMLEEDDVQGSTTREILDDKNINNNNNDNDEISNCTISHNIALLPNKENSTLEEEQEQEKLNLKSSSTPSLFDLYWLQRQLASNTLINVNELSVLISLLSVRCALANKMLSCQFTESNICERNNTQSHSPIIVDLYGAAPYHKFIDVKYGGYYLDVVQYIRYMSNESHANELSEHKIPLDRIKDITVAVLLPQVSSYDANNRQEMKRQRALERRLRKRSSASRRFDRQELNSEVSGLSLFDYDKVNLNESSINKCESSNNCSFIPISEQDVNLIYVQACSTTNSIANKYINNDNNNNKRGRSRWNKSHRICSAFLNRCDVVLCTPLTSDDGVRPRVLLNVQNTYTNNSSSSSNNSNKSKDSISFHDNVEDKVKESEIAVNHFVQVCKRATRNFARLCSQLREALTCAYANIEDSITEEHSKVNNLDSNNNNSNYSNDVKKRSGWVIYATHSLNPVENEAVVCATLTQLRREECSEQHQEQEQEEEEEWSHKHQKLKLKQCSVECVRLDSPELAALCTYEEQSILKQYMRNGTAGLSTWCSVEGVPCTHEVEQCDKDIVESVASAAWRSNILISNADGCFIILLRVNKIIQSERKLECITPDERINSSANYNSSTENNDDDTEDDEEKENTMRLSSDLLLVSNTSTNALSNNKLSTLYNHQYKKGQAVQYIMTTATYKWCTEITKRKQLNTCNSNKDYNGDDSIHIINAGVPVGTVAPSNNSFTPRTLMLFGCINDEYITQTLVNYSNLCQKRQQLQATNSNNNYCSSIASRENQQKMCNKNGNDNNNIENVHIKEFQQHCECRHYLELQQCTISCTMLAEFLRLKVIHSRSLEHYLLELKEQQRQEEWQEHNNLAELKKHFWVVKEIELFISTIKKCIAHHVINVSTEIVPSKSGNMQSSFNVCLTPKILTTELAVEDQEPQQEEKWSEEQEEEWHCREKKEQQQEYGTDWEPACTELHPLVADELHKVKIIATVTVHHHKLYKRERRITSSFLESERMPNTSFTITLDPACAKAEISMYNNELEEMSVRVRDALLYTLQQVKYRTSRASNNHSYSTFLPRSVSLPYHEQSVDENVYNTRISTSNNSNNNYYNSDYDILSPSPSSELSHQSTRFTSTDMLQDTTHTLQKSNKLRKLENKLIHSGVALRTPKNWVEQLNFLSQKRESNKLVKCPE